MLERTVKYALAPINLPKWKGANNEKITRLFLARRNNKKRDCLLLLSNLCQKNGLNLPFPPWLSGCWEAEQIEIGVAKAVEWIEQSQGLIEGGTGWHRLFTIAIQIRLENVECRGMNSWTIAIYNATHCIQIYSFIRCGSIGGKEIIINQQP